MSPPLASARSLSTPKSTSTSSLMRLVLLLLTTFLLNIGLVSAQGPTQTASNNDNATSISYMTTTVLTTLSPTQEGASPTPTSLVLTLALNSTTTGGTGNVNNNATVSTDPNTNITTIISSNSTSDYPIGTLIYPNSTVFFPNTTSLYPNGTYASANGTQYSSNGNGTIVYDPFAKEEWDGTQEWLPFEIRIDAAFGVAGGFLVVTALPLTVLGGKNRWSSMAIVSGYTTLLFTLVLILRFGVTPGILSSPTPNPPSTTLRGLYALACIIASLIGGAAGVFFYDQTKYLVPAMGGFAFGWFIEACKASGATGNSIVGRWGLIGGFTVLLFILGLVSTFHYHLILISTAFIGATAFTLGIDCFTRAGLKEFYIYNLGFRGGLFPKLWAQKEGEVGRWVFPLATIMQVELGVLVAVFLIGTAIQYRILGMLQIKLEQIKKEDAERKEAEEEARSATRFKEHGDELEKWESKYGNTKGLAGDVPLVTLGKDGHPSSSMQSLVRPYTANGSEGAMNDPGSMEMMRPSNSHSQSDTRSLGGQSVGRLPIMALGDGISPALGEDGREQSRSPTSMAEMSPEERERIRLLDEISEVKKSIEVLRSTTPTSVDMLSTSGSFTAGQGSRSRTVSGMSLGAASFASGLNGGGPAGSMGRAAQPSPITAPTPTAAEIAQAKKDKEWNDYLASRHLFTPPAGVSPPIESSFPHRARQADGFGRLSKISDSVVQAMERRDRTVSAYELGVNEMDREEVVQPHSATLPLGRQPQSAGISPRESTYQHNRHSSAPLITGHAYSGTAKADRKRESVESTTRPAAERTITHEELTARHRAKLSQLQKPVSESMQEEIRLTEAKAKYEQQKEAERKMMARKEAERKLSRPIAGKPEREAAGPDPRHVPRESAVDRAAQWRQSVAAENMQRPVLDTAPEITQRARRENPRRGSATMDRTSMMDPINQRQSRGPNQYIN